MLEKCFTYVGEYKIASVKLAKFGQKCSAGLIAPVIFNLCICLATKIDEILLVNFAESNSFYGR